MKEPVDHVLRPRLPWRDESEPAITECGYDASKVKSISRPEFFQRLKDFGKQRTAMLTCMTCADATQRWEPWADDARKALEREIQWECGWRRGKQGHRLKDELLAIENLVEKNREQFLVLLAYITQRREWLEKKAKLDQKPPVIRAGKWHLL